jgi:hypothetical protein
MGKSYDFYQSGDIDALIFFKEMPSEEKTSRIIEKLLEAGIINVEFSEQEDNSVKFLATVDTGVYWMTNKKFEEYPEHFEMDKEMYGDKIWSEKSLDLFIRDTLSELGLTVDKINYDLLWVEDEETIEQRWNEYQKELYEEDCKDR